MIHLSSVSSTNLYALELCREKKIEEGTVIWADEQLQGKGRHEKKWESVLGKSLTFSYIHFGKLPVERQFELSIKVALSVQQALDSLSVKSKIKWPNDLLINRKKVGGILIHNSIQGTKINQSIIGIGINVKQSDFSEFHRQATSLKLITGKDIPIGKLLEEVVPRLNQNVTAERSWEELKEEYLDKLYGFRENIRVKPYHSDAEMKGKIVDLLPDGRIIFKPQKGSKKWEFGLDELLFID